MQRLGRSLCLVGLLVGLFGSSAWAQAPGGRTTVPKDPKGIKGISPFWENLKRGDNAYVAREYDAAISSFREAIDLEPKNALGHYRLGEAHRAKGSLDEAEKAWKTGLRVVGADHVLRGKLLFVLADLAERRKAYAVAAKAWSDYGAFVAQQPKARGYPKTAGERKKRAEEYAKLVEEYAAVRQRIEQRLKEAEDKARNSAR
jgi:tetratricopeptide (TPR) repeat protein